MDFFEKIGETITDKSKEAVDKAKEFAEIARLKSQIGICEDVIKKNYMEIGKHYYEQYGNEPEERFAESCRAIDNAKTGVQELRKEIREIKGL